MLKRLRIKFICVIMAIVLAMLAVIFGLVIGSTRQNLERDALAVMQSALNDRGPRMPFGLFEDEDLSQRPWGTPPELAGVSLPYLRVDLDTEGNINAVEGFFHDASWAASDSRSELTGLLDTVLAQEADSGVLSDRSLRYLRESGPMGTRLVFVDMSNELSTMENLTRSSLLIGGASLVVFFLLSLLLARWAVRPVETAWQQQKQFVSDASHELKTPLTVIMTNAELLQSPDYPPEAKGKCTENILTMTRQMRGLVESLLELARMENGAVAAATAELDFSALCADAVLPFEPLYFEKGLTLETELAENVRLRGSESHLRQVLEIFLDNAQKYADPDSAVTVTLTRTGGKSCRLCVANQGPEIAPEDLSKLFERFYRADKARSRDGSYGLGLSIARKIVEDHHGKIWAESKNGVNSFIVTLPCL